jgi:MFS family permease
MTASGPRLLPIHLLAICCTQATSMAVQVLLAVLARKHFDANNWQTLVITAAPTVLFSLSVFWNHLFNHMRYRQYVLVYWLVACSPMLFMALDVNIWGLMLAHVVASAGGAGYYPAASDLLKHIYPAQTRGRWYSVVWAGSLVANAAISYGLGHWLQQNETAFRIFLPATALIQGVGVLAFIWLHRITGGDSERRIEGGRLLSMRSIVEPITHMKDVLKADRNFALYEAAYMTYGVGWMIGYALLPAFVTDHLTLDYDQIAQSTQVAYLAGLLLAIFPAGYLMDRIGAARTTGLSFLTLAAYPLALLIANGHTSLALVSLYYGLAHSGASVGWMLGPVSFAPTPDKVPQYVAIHATFVGIRGKIFQGLGVLIYSLTGSFAIPFVVAAGAYAWSSWQMFSLYRRMKK